MLTNELKNITREIREIRTVQFVPGVYADITLDVGKKNKGESIDTYRVTFPNPRRVDVFADETFNLTDSPEFQNVDGSDSKEWLDMTLAFPDFPDVYEAPSSNYLKRYKNLEESGKSLRHFLICTDANGMLHVLTHTPPVLTSFPDYF